jgi:hypothetical protein
MSPSDFYNELKGWQTGISSMLGFLALSWAALYNFKLNRRRDVALKDEETLSVATALYGEILLLRKEVGHLAKVVANVENYHVLTFDEYFLEAHPLSEPLLYKALATKIGLLSTDLILGITEVHQNLQEAKNSLPLLVKKPERGYGHSVLTFLIPARDAVKNIQLTLDKIERMAKILKAAENIDLGDAENVINREEEAFLG